MAHCSYCLLVKETEALCGYSGERLKDVHPVLMGNEVTQLPGIPPGWLVSGMWVPSLPQAPWVQFLLGNILGCLHHQDLKPPCSVVPLFLWACWSPHGCLGDSPGEFRVLPWPHPHGYWFTWAGLRPEHWNLEKLPR